jgi:hypothetical protein
VSQLHALRLRRRDEPEPEIIDVLICKLRKKLATLSKAATSLKPCGAAATCRKPHEEEVRIPA